jgi:hypothetical protein
MNWKRLWTRKAKRPKTIILEPDGPFNLNWIWPKTSLNINHTVIHTPYPRPHTILIRAQSRSGRQWQLPPIFCRGGSHYSITMPPQYEGDEWQMLDIDIHYE